MDSKIKQTLATGLICSASLLLSACNPAPTNASKHDVMPQAKVELNIKAPAGAYAVDLNHASLSFSASHMGLAPYTAHFRKYQAELNLDPNGIGQSTINITVDPLSIATSYVADYKATHADSKFASWEEDLARSDRFLMADQHPDIGFSSSSVREDGKGNLLVDGQLKLRGQSHPLQLQVELTGSTAKHPFTKKGAVGFVAKGQFKRSQYGMTFMQGPGLLGDEVTIRFEGEFHQAS
ncbi:MAG: YceI family protein [Oceanococcus sp.]